MVVMASSSNVTPGSRVMCWEGIAAEVKFPLLKQPLQPACVEGLRTGKSSVNGTRFFSLLIILDC